MTYYRNLLAIAAVGVFYTNVPTYAYQFMPDVQPLWWILGFSLLLIPLLISDKTPWSVLRAPIALWCFGYIWLTIIWFFLSSQLELPWQEVRWRFLTVFSVMCFLLLFWDAGAIQWARRAIVVTTLFAVAINIYEFFIPLSFSMVSARSAGLYGNPNEAGEILVLGMILSVTCLPARYRGPFMLLAGVGIVSTLSRSGIFAWLLSIMAFALLRMVSARDLLLWAIMGFVGIIVSQGTQLLTISDSIDIYENNRDVRERLLWFTGSSGFEDDSTWERKIAAKRVWAEVADYPWFGSGTGSSLTDGSTVATHNQYLSHMQDHGLVVGSTILPLLVLSVIWKSQGGSRWIALIFGCVLMWQGLFSHGFLNLQEKVLLIALMAAIAGMSRKKDVVWQQQ